MIRERADAAGRQRDAHRWLEEAGTLKHHTSISPFADRIVNTQEGLLDLRGDTLALASAPGPFERAPRTPRLAWKRAEENLRSRAREA